MGTTQRTHYITLTTPLPCANCGTSTYFAHAPTSSQPVPLCMGCIDAMVQPAAYGICAIRQALTQQQWYAKQEPER